MRLKTKKVHSGSEKNPIFGGNKWRSTWW